MGNEAGFGQLAELADMVRESMSVIADTQRKVADLTATATVARGRVTVVLNADNIVIETRFADDIDDLTPAELASAVTAASQQAARSITEQTGELMSVLRESAARVPRLSEFLPELPDVADMLPDAPRAALTPPGARSRQVEPEDAVEPEMHFTEVDHVRDRAASHVWTEKLW